MEMKASRTTAQKSEDGAVLGDFRALGRVLGASDGPGCLDAAVLSGAASRDAPAVREFVLNYRRTALLPVEMPLIREAYLRAARRETRELVKLDASFSAEKLSPEMAGASRRIGLRHLKAMRPMRDERIARRYLSEVEAGRAHGWHTVVYGLFLALHSLPLRQGLLNYARQTQAGFILSAAGRGNVSETEALAMIDEFDAGLPAFLKELPGLDSGPMLLLV
jgi:urease accessory protein UreF